jgi:PAS domain S-box-containing protein
MSANKKTESITGYGRDELKNMKFRDFLLPDSSENIMDLLFSISSGGSSVKHEVAIKNRAGKEKILELSVQIHSWKKKDRCLFIIARDVTVKKKAEEELSLYRSHLEDIVSRRTKELETANTELAEEKERITVTLESIADGVMTTDDRNNVVIINSSASEISGFAPNEASGSHVSDIIELSDKDMNNIDELLNCVMAKRRPAEICADLLIRKTGKEIPVMLSAAPISAGGSDASGCVIVFRDISERIRFEEEVLKRQKLESIGILAGGIAHDFNNILTSIAGNIMIAKNSVPEDDPVYKRLNEAEKAVIRAKDITGQLITFSKGGTPVKQTSDIRDLITETAEFVSHGSSIKLHTDIECGLKPVDVDEGQISQVIENLVINAIQAMPEGGNIYITAVNEGMISGAENLSDGEYISISVTDEGSGINSENLKKIFDPYFTTKKKGNGLGLASCLSIIRKHGGNIIVKSKAGTGSEFKIYLPVSDKPVAEKGADYEGRLCGSGRILLMDDDINICNTVPDLLRSYGFDVDFATDGAEAIRKYQETKTLGRDYDLYIFDLTVPGGLGGVDTIKILKEFEPKIKAIVSSGYFDDPVMANYADYGFSAVFPKPYDFKKLIAVINKLIHE